LNKLWLAALRGGFPAASAGRYSRTRSPSTQRGAERLTILADDTKPE
jgi:hypothetical protein